jgi:hypothetical protein
MSQHAMSDAEVVTTGHINALKIVTTTVENGIDDDEYGYLIYNTEAQDCQNLCYGRSNAKSVTLSFWAKSKVAGNYGVTLYQQDGSEMIGGVYTLVADTWKKVEITFAGNTGSNIVNDNGQGIQIKWGLIIKSDGDYAGTDNTSWGAYASGKLMHGHTAVWGTSTSHDFYLTGVQLEVGSNATPFEHRSYGDELSRCQRYYQNSFAIGNVPGVSTVNEDSQISTSWTDGNAPFHNPFCTDMRAAPTVVLRGRGSTTTGEVNNGGTYRTASATSPSTKGIAWITVTSGTGGQYNAFTFELKAEL